MARFCPTGNRTRRAAYPYAAASRHTRMYMGHTACDQSTTKPRAAQSGLAVVPDFLHNATRTERSTPHILPQPVQLRSQIAFERCDLSPELIASSVGTRAHWQDCRGAREGGVAIHTSTYGCLCAPC